MLRADADGVLARREERAAQQRRLAADGCPVLSLTVVSPGCHKDDRAARLLHAGAVRAAEAALAGAGLAVAAREDASGPTGPETLWAVHAEAAALKRLAVRLEEEHAWGRLWDLDVLVADGGLMRPVSRDDLGLPRRRCLVCGGPAVACARGRTHPLPVLLAAREAIVAGRGPDADAHAWADRAVAALIVEAELTPKPGLVDRENRGAHDDMDLPMLEASAHALRDWFLGCVLVGRRPGEVLDDLVALGVGGEAAMRAATGGPNTHKGALYSLGILLAAIGRADAPTLAGVLADAARIGTALRERWLASGGAASTHGERAWQRHGLGGARAQAASGFATVAAVGLPEYRRRLASGAGEEDALRWCLVALMAANDDTNLVARGGPDGLQDVRAWASRLLERRPGPGELARELRAANGWFVERRLSPGGSADLLAVTWLLAGLADDPD